jgi:hypothetical protein
MVDPNNWYQSKVHLGVAAVAGSVMAFGGSSGGEVAGPCVGLCVVTGGSRRCGSGSCVGPAGRAVLDDVCRQRGRAFVARPCVGLCMGAGVAAADHVLVLPDVCARRAYVTKEEGRSSGCSGVYRQRRRPGVCRLASGPCVDPTRRRLCARGRVSSREGSCVGAWRDDIVHRSGGSTPAAAVWLGGMEKVVVVAAASAKKEKALLADVEEEYALL